jgi:hypothetical protein
VILSTANLSIDSFLIATMGFIMALHQFHGEQGSEAF